MNIGDTYCQRTAGRSPGQELLLAPERLALALLGRRLDRPQHRDLAQAQPAAADRRATGSARPTRVVIFADQASRATSSTSTPSAIPHRTAAAARPTRTAATLYQGGNSGLGTAARRPAYAGNRRGKNPGDVWTIATAVDRLGHQATFPEALIERPILATCPERICVQCDPPGPGRRGS